MKILWLTWKDRQHPLAGGAETVNEELAKRLAKDGHEVKLIVGGFKGGKPQETVNGFEVTRLGNRYSVYWKAFRYYRKQLQGWPDLLIDEVNTVPFFAKFYAKERTVLFAHMLCRQIWFYELWFPLSLIGYLAEPLYLYLLRNQDVITVSESTKKDLAGSGFNPNRIHVISEGIELEPLRTLPPASSKFGHPTLLSLGAMRSMKRTLDQIKAFEIAKRDLPELKLVVAGDSSGRYGKKVLRAIKNSPFASDITYKGKVSKADKLVLMRQSHIIMVTSIKEGWGLIVTEAASQGTPAVVYDVDGLRDSVRHGHTGLVTKLETPTNLANYMYVLLSHQDDYEQIRRQAWEASKEVTFERGYKDFKGALKI
jgi:glycosyltransferase involved in cell wall biosynthesis